MWRLWQNRIPIGQGPVKIKIESEVKCCCCNGNQQESFEHLFVQCADAIKLLNMFAGAVGIECSVVRWACHVMGYKCNIDGGLNVRTDNFSIVFCITDVEGNFVYAETRNIGKEPVLATKIKALRIGLEYCCNHNLMPMVLETYSLVCKRVLHGGTFIKYFSSLIEIPSTGKAMIQLEKLDTLT
ncbi:hypothetical protein RDI58_013571 [Solanum bulbocastanum]|uniref:Reverse transcriptase zinc-binding domain-containing protein n=1 Tax=Solanum bulbocastanum TaxID=147425 RepID=A0AAN8TTW9_SOLBU